jgi:hypothetical protein
MKKDQIRGISAMYGELRIAYKVLVSIHQEKIPLERPRRRWVDNIKWILEKSGVKMWIGFNCFRIGFNG